MNRWSRPSSGISETRRPAGGITVTRLALSARDDLSQALKDRYLGEAPAAVYLIRPDQHVAARRASFDDRLFRAAIRRAMGQEVAA